MTTRSQKNMAGTKKTTTFIVCGMVCQGENEQSASLDMKMLGAFQEYSDAALCRDLYADIDTTFDVIDIVAVPGFSEVPSFDVMVRMSVSQDGEFIDMYSTCASEDDQPWLSLEDDSCEAYAYPEDIDSIIAIMKQWCMDNRDTSPEVRDNISPLARELM